MQVDRKGPNPAVLGDDLQPLSRRPSALHRRKSSALISPAELEKESVVESQNALMRQHWNKAMHRELGTPDRYQNVAVLIVRWVEALDTDLQCWREVCTLAFWLWSAGCSLHLDSATSLTNFSKRGSRIRPRSLPSTIKTRSRKSCSMPLLQSLSKTTMVRTEAIYWWCTTAAMASVR